MTRSARERLARGESGLTLMELVVVLAIIGILLGIAVGASLGFAGRASKTGAQGDIRTIIPSIESWNQDNTGRADDVDSTAATSGYEGMTVAQLKSNYDQSLDASSTSPFRIDPSGFSSSPADYCVTATVGDWTGYKHGPNGTIKVTPTAQFDASTCS
jgi:prepilin-type N-terminal cleavage/methylation domain-containing protein